MKTQLNVKLFSNDEISARNRQDPYYEQFKLYLHLFRVFGRIPFETTLTGKLQIRYNSRIALYSVVVFSLQLYSIYLVFLWQIPRIQKDGSFDNVISSVLVLLCLNFHYDILLHSWWEAPTFVAYFESWKKFNNTFMTELKMPVPSRLTIRIKVFVISSAIIYIIVIIFETKFLLKDLDWYLCWPLFSVAYNVTLLSTFWFFNCLMICHTAEELNNQIVKVLNGSPYRHQVYKYRFLMFQLRTLITEFGNILSRTILGGIFTLFLVIVLAMYGVITVTLQEDFDRLLSIIIPLLFGFIHLYIYCEGSYRLSNKVNQETLRNILECKFVSLRQEVHQEVELLLDTVKNIRANMELLGLFVMNRKTITQVLGVTVSYLMVLAQFRVTDTSSLT